MEGKIKLSPGERILFEHHVQLEERVERLEHMLKYVINNNSSLHLPNQETQLRWSKEIVETIAKKYPSAGIQ